jgi:hypothetical protein
MIFRLQMAELRKIPHAETTCLSLLRSHYPSTINFFSNLLFNAVETVLFSDILSYHFPCHFPKDMYINTFLKVAFHFCSNK